MGEHLLGWRRWRPELRPEPDQIDLAIAKVQADEDHARLVADRIAAERRPEIVKHGRRARA